MKALKMDKAVFEFIAPDNRVYSAHWYPKGSDNYSGYYDDSKTKRRFEVTIWRGGGYKISYYTDHRICEKNSLEFINRYLKQQATTT